MPSSHAKLFISFFCAFWWIIKGKTFFFDFEFGETFLVPKRKFNWGFPRNSFGIAVLGFVLVILHHKYALQVQPGDPARKLLTKRWKTSQFGVRPIYWQHCCLNKSLNRRRPQAFARRWACASSKKVSKAIGTYLCIPKLRSL